MLFAAYAQLASAASCIIRAKPATATGISAGKQGKSVEVAYRSQVDLLRRQFEVPFVPHAGRVAEVGEPVPIAALFQQPTVCPVALKEIVRLDGSRFVPTADEVIDLHEERS